MDRLNDSVIKKIAGKPFLFLFLDYDGTLTPIASGPSKAKLSPSVRSLLRELKAMRGIKVAIVSGRSLGNLKRYVRVPGLIYAGNHGFEVHGPGVSYIHPEALTQKRLFSKLTGYFRKALSGYQGFFIEHKTFSISIHYRHVTSARLFRAARRVLLKKLESLKHTPIALKGGKKVWEIRPTAQWHKGKTVLWLISHAGGAARRPFPVYMGDDVTDEDAFSAIRKNGIGIKVIGQGKGRSHAQYFVRSSGEAVRFLRRLVALRKHKGHSNV